MSVIRAKVTRGIDRSANFDMGTQDVLDYRCTGANSLYSS